MERATEALMPPAVATRLILAGVGFQTRIHGAHPAAHVTARFGAFAAGESPEAGDADSPSQDEDLTLDITVDPAWRAPRAARESFPGAEATRLPDGSVYFLRATDELTYDPARRLALGRTHGTALGLQPVEDPTPLDPPLRQLLSYELPRRGGLLVHACGYADPRGAVLFIAPSGGGKTTTARKLPHAGVLSDDQVALRRTSTGWIAWALPFVGEYARAIRPQRAVLRAVVLLARSPVVTLSRVLPAMAVPRVLAGTVYFLRGDPSTAGLLDLAIDLVSTVPTHVLALPRDAPVDPIVNELLR